VISPLRQVNGLMAAISTGVDVFLGQKEAPSEKRRGRAAGRDVYLSLFQRIALRRRGFRDYRLRKVGFDVEPLKGHPISKCLRYR